MTTTNFVSTVQEDILIVEERMRSQADGHHPDLKAAMEHLLDSGGKRIRPTIVLLSGGMLGANHEDLVTLAAAVELLHTATLVHDDMIDGALLRRGMPTLNSKWSPAATILTGDFIFARAAKLAAETRSIEVMNMFANTLSVLVSGEITQMFNSKGLASRDDYFNRIYAKTASMFELAASATVYLDTGREDAYENMKQFGYEIGMAFQIVDDILDFTGAQSDVGKPVANDLRQGLVTLPALCYLEKYPENPDMVKAVSGVTGDDALMERLVEAVRNSGAISQAMEEAKSFVSRGLKVLEGMPDSQERAVLEDLAHYVVDREV